MQPLELGFFSLPALNIGTAKTFYQSVMGWKFNDRDPKFSYIFADEKMIGALEVASERFKPSAHGPLLYFRALSMERTLASVVASGGTVSEKLSIEDGTRGFTAKIQDPSGNTIGFWAPEN
jgi:predicted enzyme related to lactoylglutathione lyase